MWSCLFSQKEVPLAAWLIWLCQFERWGTGMENYGGVGGGGYEERQVKDHWRKRRKCVVKTKGWRGEEERMGLQLNCYMLHPV